MTDDPKTAALKRARDWFMANGVSGPYVKQPDWDEAGNVLADILFALPDDCEGNK